jgi:hypothetical protein
VWKTFSRQKMNKLFNFHFLGQGIGAGDSTGSGAGYGGRGGLVSNGGTPGSPYGSILYPTDFGSGGGGSQGGKGGGFLELEIRGSLVVDGMLH